MRIAQKILDAFGLQTKAFSPDTWPANLLAAPTVVEIARPFGISPIMLDGDAPRTLFVPMATTLSLCCRHDDRLCRYAMFRMTPRSRRLLASLRFA